MKLLIILTIALSAFLPNRTEAYSPEQILTEVNKHRAVPLKMNPQLRRAAQDKANQLVACQCLEHSLNGKQFFSTIQEHRISYAGSAENLARGYKDTKGLVRGWLNSPSHRRNMLAPYTETGIAVARGKYKGKTAYYVVQLFITPFNN